MSITAYEGQYEGEAAIWLKAGRYEAAILPRHWRQPDLFP